MINTVAIKVPVLESEAGWGQKIDDYMVCLSVSDAYSFISEFNVENDKDTTPAWYMKALTDIKPIDLDSKKHNLLLEQDDKRMWLSQLKKL